MNGLQGTCTCGHGERDHDAYEPPHVCGHGMSVETPDGDCDCMDYDQAVALVNARTLAELRAAREVVEAVRPYVKRVPDEFQSSPDRPLASALATYDKAVAS